MSQFPLDPAQWPTPAEAYPPAPRVAVRLMDADKSKPTASNTAAATPPKGHYIILGCGLAAVLNHTLLRQTRKGKERLKDPTNDAATLPVVHIGFEDPWRTYHPHGMGQPPYLLNMPGFHNRPGADAPMIRSGMRSTEFAGFTKQEWDLLKQDRPFRHIEGWVPVIQHRQGGGDPMPIEAKILDLLEKEGLSRVEMEQQLSKKYPEANPPFRVLVVSPDQKMSLLYAYKIDICTGAGRPTVPDLEGCKEGRTTLWTPPARWDGEVKARRVVNGPEALCSHTPWKADDRVCVFGAGGIGLNMVERAEDVGCWIDWLPNPMPGSDRYPPATTLHRTFNLERNDTVLRHAKGSGGKAGLIMEPGEATVRSAPGNPSKLDFKLVPGKDKWRFGAHVGLEGVAETGGGVSVQFSWFKPRPEAPAVMLDYDENETGLVDGAFGFSPWYTGAHDKLAKRCPDKKVYDRLCVCAGLLNADALGTPDTVADAVPLQRLVVNGRTVGLESSNDGGRLRVLGAAGVMYPGAQFALNQHADTNKYFTSLPVSAVQPGFIYAGVTIAAANGWFEEVPNTNINTMEQNELITALKRDMAEADAAKLGEALVIARRGLNGFGDLDAAAVFIRSKDDLKNLAAWQTAMSKLATAYPVPLAWWT